ncbi:MAG TPA: hypothetical protein VH951_03845 [Dehalococcoidia bacterium]|jgi:hypothetical protein
MEILALLLVVLLIGLVWVVVVPYESGEAPVPVEMPRPSDFATALARGAAKRSSDGSPHDRMIA